MSILIQYVATYAPWIYAVCGLVALYQMYKVWLVRAERRQAVFSLEREKAVRDMYGILSVAMLLLLIMGVTYFTSTTLSNAVEPLVEQATQPTPALPLIPTPTNTPLPATATPTITPTSPPGTPEAPTPDTLAAPTATAAPAQPVVQAPACPDGRAVITRPGNNEVVHGTISVIGTANHEQFQFYKIEYAPSGSESFSWIGGGNSPVIGGVLTTIDTTALSNGVWTLRLIVVDQTGNFPDPCQVTIQVQN